MLIVGIDEAAVEADLIGGRLSCPNCESGLRPWGHGDRAGGPPAGAGASAAASGARSAGPAPPPTSWSPRTPCCAGVTASRSSAPPWRPRPRARATAGSPRPRPAALDGAGLAAPLRRHGRAPCGSTSPAGPMRSTPAMTGSRPVARPSATPWRPSACSGSWPSAASGPARRGRSPRSSPAAGCCATRAHPSAQPV